jgi:hypothetical protein
LYQSFFGPSFFSLRDHQILVVNSLLFYDLYSSSSSYSFFLNKTAATTEAEITIVMLVIIQASISV